MSEPMDDDARTLADPRGRGTVTFAVTAADSGGSLLSTVSRLRPGFPRPPLHVHPHQSESFHVRRGTLAVWHGRERLELAPGESFTVAPGTPHTFAPAGPREVEVQVDFRPAGEMEGFLRGLWALARDGRMSARGRPALLPGAALARRHAADFRVARVPAVLQRAGLAVLGRLSLPPEPEPEPSPRSPRAHRPPPRASAAAASPARR
jgi:mannose-6-phosphate isomerase-like protein (cupin superfamily)